jgi:hypothetical protein
VAPRLRQIEQRTAELEQRGVGTAAPGVAQ